MRIHLQFSPEQNAAHRSRLAYAFRTFCAIYGHLPLVGEEQEAAGEITIEYHRAARAKSRKPTLALRNLYQPRSPRQPAPPPTAYSAEGETTVVVHSSAPGQRPDWLGEIFEWLSCADEYSIEERDPWQRVPFQASYVGRYRLDARVPYAAVAMRLLNVALYRALGQPPPSAPSPAPPTRHFIIPTHDVDYLPLGTLGRTYRLAKNAVISWLAAKRPALGLRQAGMALRVALGGSDPLDQINYLVAGESGRSIGASYYFLLQRQHRRDANYSLGDPGVVDLLRSLQARGMEVGVHGTYRSSEKLDGLAHEFTLLRKAGMDPLGGRQHWLRFTLPELIRGLERAGALYDTSLGWADRIGFRAGACFAFPLYNFDQERPSSVLEIPLVMMDVAIRDQGLNEEDWYGAAAQLLEASRRYGWGGISLLWHPTAFGGGWLAREAGDVFWRLSDQRAEHNETWLSAAAFLDTARDRYLEAGLWPAERDHSDIAREDRRDKDIGLIETFPVSQNYSLESDRQPKKKNDLWPNLCEPSSRAMRFWPERHRPAPHSRAALQGEANGMPNGPASGGFHKGWTNTYSRSS